MLTFFFFYKVDYQLFDSSSTEGSSSGFSSVFSSLSSSISLVYLLYKKEAISINTPNDTNTIVLRSVSKWVMS